MVIRNYSMKVKAFPMNTKIAKVKAPVSRRTRVAKVKSPSMAGIKLAKVKNHSSPAPCAVRGGFVARSGRSSELLEDSGL